MSHHLTPQCGNRAIRLIVREVSRAVSLQPPFSGLNFFHLVSMFHHICWLRFAKPYRDI